MVTLSVVWLLASQYSPDCSSDDSAAEIYILAQVGTNPRF
jgi:hypothetical protein